MLFTIISVINIEIIILGCISTGYVTTSHAQVLPDNSLFTDGLFNLEYHKLQLTLQMLTAYQKESPQLQTGFNATRLR